MNQGGRRSRAPISLDKMSNVLQTHLCIFFTCPKFFLKLKQAHPTNLNFFWGGGTHVKTKSRCLCKKKRQHWSCAWICYFLVLDPHLKANLWLSSNKIALFHWTLDHGSSSKVAQNGLNSIMLYDSWFGKGTFTSNPYVLPWQLQH
jgi:hypothetical protein